MTGGGEGRWARRPGRVLARSDRLLLTRLRRSDAAAVAAAVDDDTRRRFGWSEGDALREVDRVRRGQFNLYRGAPADLAFREHGSNRYLGSCRAGWDGLDETTTELEVRWYFHPSARGTTLEAEALQLVVTYFIERTPAAELRAAPGDGGTLFRMPR